MKPVIWALILNVLFTIIEFISGFISNSTAILSDAVHDLGDSLAIGFALILIRISHNNPNDQYPYGYSRWSIVSSLLTSLILIVGAVFIVQEAIEKLIIGDYTIRAQIVIPVAIVGVIFNGLAARFLFHAHDQNDHAQRSIALHFLEDILGWVAVLIGAILIYFTDFHAIDPILSIIISIFIAWNALKKWRQVFPIILQTFPKNVDRLQLMKTLDEHLGKRAERKIKGWTLDGKQHVLILFLNSSERERMTDANLKSALESALNKMGFHYIDYAIE